MSLGPDTCFRAIILSTTAWGGFLFLFYGRGNCAASGPICPQIHLLKLPLFSLIWQGVLTPAGWFPLGLASGNALAWGWGGWRLYYFLALASIRHVCPGSSFYRETPAPDCGNTGDSLWPWGGLVSFRLWLIFESPRSSLFGFPALHLLCIQFHTINSLCFKYSEKFLFFWMKQKLQEVK